MSRLRIFSLFALLLAFATAFVACGGGDGDGGGGDAEAVLEDATLEGIESGTIDLVLGIDVKGKEGGTVDVSLSGPFQGEGAERLPQLDLTLKADGSIGGEDIDFEGGAVLLPNKAYVNYEGTEYEVDPTTFSFLEAALQEAQQGGGDEGGATACQEAFGELNVANFADNLVEDGGADVGGTPTTKVSGDLDVSGAIDTLVELAKSPSCQSQLSGAGALPSDSEVETAKDEIANALDRAHIEVYVGEDDIVRRIAAQLSIEPKKGGGGESVDLDFDLTLTGVNEDQVIAAPAGKTKPLSNLFIKLGVNPLELLSLIEGEGGAGGIAGLIEGLTGAAGGSGKSGSSGGSADSGAYADCLRDARSAADIQACTPLLE